jgi:hypothetical protein
VGTPFKTPVFCDESGVRSVLMQWGGRAAGLLVLLLFAGLALTLQTRVEVPGLSRLLPATLVGSELFHAPVRRAGADSRLVRPDNVMVPEASDQTVAGPRDLPVRKPNSAASTIEPVAEPAVTQVQPTDQPLATTIGPTPSATASPSAKQRNPKAAAPREDPNAQGSTAHAHGQAKAKSKGKRGSGSSPEAGAEPTAP